MQCQTDPIAEGIECTSLITLVAMVVATTEITLAANKVMTVAVVANVLERK